FSPCGTIPENWKPTAMNATPATPTATAPSIATNFTLSPILAPLAPHQQDIVVIRGVNMESTQAQYGPIANVHDQGMTHMLTGIGLVKGPSGAGRANHFLDGSAGGPSIDQHIAAAIGGTTRLKSLQVGVETSQTFLEVMVTRMCYGPVTPMTVNGTNYPLALPVPTVDDPVSIYTRLFGTATMGTTDQITQALKNRKSVLDYVINDYTDLMGRLGSADKSKLDQHLNNCREIETRLTQQIGMPVAGTCPGASAIMPATPARTKCLRDQDLRTPSELAMQTPNFCVTDFVGVGKMQMDLMVLAMQCDLTRVASMQWSTAESTVVHGVGPGWLTNPLQYTGTKEHHMLTHNESSAATATGNMVNQAAITMIRQDLTNVHTWYAQQFAYMIGKMKAIQEGAGTLLDNTLLFWTNELGIGGTHEYTNIPYVLAGKCGGQLTTGRYLDFLGTRAAGYGMGPAHNKLFVSFLQKMGINQNTFGLTNFSGPLPGL
ncbi:MAG: DUF1552 domain-containing protein, partial [Pseudomonadota bacterium]